MIFATFALERDPLKWADLPALLETWLRNAGGIAAVALLAYAIFRWFRPASVKPVLSPLERWLFRIAVLGIFAGYGLYGIMMAPEILGGVMSSVETDTRKTTAFGSEAMHRGAVLVGAVSALIAVAFPFLVDLSRLRWRRIWAMARLSFKEAIRRRVLWVFSALLLVFLFGGWFIEYKPENQVRNYVHVIYWAMTPLLLLTAGLLAAFSIPADIRSQTIHTIVTKPVERFEIVLGRFLGFTLLMTLVLLVMTGISVLYMFRQIDQEAAFESMKARVPIYIPGKLEFRTKDAAAYEGDNVGREWEYRRYIAGGHNSPHRIVWIFPTLPSGLGDVDKRGPTIPCEFSFDIFRTLKGEEGKGVFCSFAFITDRWDPKLKTQYDQDREQERKKPDATPDKVDALLAEKYGIFEIASKEIADYHTDRVNIPTVLFRKGGTAGPDESKAGQAAQPRNALQVSVKCESGGQYLGAAKYDFYILDSERPFWLNFFKGAAGLWLRLCVVIGLAIASSTYLSGVIAWLTTMFIYTAGLFQDYVKGLAENTSVGGGPMESFVRLVKHEPLVSPLESTPTTQLAQGTDEMYRWVLRRFLDILPDVERLDWTDYVAEGFNISTLQVLSLNSVMLAGYLLPWAILSYYLMKTREIATY